MTIATKPIELGVCLLDDKTKGTWGYHIVGIPTTTADDQVLEAATKAFLNSHETALVHHTWVQSVGAEAILGENVSDVGKDEDDVA